MRGPRKSGSGRTGGWTCGDSARWGRGCRRRRGEAEELTPSRGDGHAAPVIDMSDTRGDQAKNDHCARSSVPGAQAFFTGSATAGSPRDDVLTLAAERPIANGTGRSSRERSLALLRRFQRDESWPATATRRTSTSSTPLRHVRQPDGLALSSSPAPSSPSVSRKPSGHAGSILRVRERSI